MEEILRVCVPIAARYGFSHSWEQTKLDTGAIRTICTFTHYLGHFTQSTFDSPVERIKKSDGTFSDTENQASGKANTYGERYTYKACTGIVAEDDTDDNDVEQVGLSAGEIEEIYQTVIGSDDPKLSWKHFSLQLGQQKDIHAFTVLKARITEWAKNRKLEDAPEAIRDVEPETTDKPIPEGLQEPKEQNERLKAEVEKEKNGRVIKPKRGRPKKDENRRAVSPGITANCFGPNEIEDVNAILRKINQSWGDITQYLSRYYGQSLENVLMDDWEKLINELMDIRPEIDGRTKLNYREINQLEIMLDTAGVKVEDFVSYHGVPMWNLDLDDREAYQNIDNLPRSGKPILDEDTPF